MDVDTLQLYQWAVQDPVTHARLMSIIYARVRGGAEARLLREDFAGTSADAIAWVAASAQRRAIAVEIDRPTVAWARASARRALGEAAERITHVESDVLEAGPPALPRADITIALNFSLFSLHDRARMLQYLQHTRDSMAEHGVLVFNAFGGPGAMQSRTDSRTVRRPAAAGAAGPGPATFTCHWEQRVYDAATNRVDCRIHFTLPARDAGGQAVQVMDAFRYDFRLWTLPELVEVVREAGFAEAQIWRHTYDASKGADGVFLGPVQHITSVDTWTAYVVAAV